jgi:hypothetical protein
MWTVRNSLLQNKAGCCIGIGILQSKQGVRAQLEPEPRKSFLLVNVAVETDPVLVNESRADIFR